MSNLVPYNISLPAASGVFTYAPLRGVGADLGWNMTFTDSAAWPNGELDFPGEGVGFFQTERNGAEINLSFEGTGLYLCLTPNGAGWALTVDGTLYDTQAPGSDNACEGYGAETLVVADDLKYGKHDALLRVSAREDAAFRFFGGVVTAGVNTDGEGAKVESRMIDDSDKAWVYKPDRGGGQWDSRTRPDIFNLTSTFDCTYSAEHFATYTFTGYSAVVLYGAPYRDSRAYTVKLDEETFRSDVHPGGWSLGSTPLYIKGGLDPNAQHTLTFTNFRDDNEKCLQPRPVAGDLFCCSSLDALELIGASAAQDPGPSSVGTTPSPSQTNVGAIAGGVVGGVAVIMLLVALFFLFRRRRSQNAKAEMDGPATTELGPSLSAASQSQHVYGVVEPFSIQGADSGTGYRDASSAPVSYGRKSGQRPSSSEGNGSRITTSPLTTQGDSSDIYYGTPRQPVTDSQANTSTVRLAPEDLNQVLAFVAQRMDPAAVDRSVQGDTLPPTYRP
ncbi:hypothetical protein AURDEDRAFT_171377 [Auricularia subglabra TFB-10046 SS5]|uniref:Epidermal growth factor receptor-like transmembrane-juxtamembrane segment domain-containing protein n=1 Tax=Auricularia subglabra (strain TFB-10046 / SS5) TaxID=717982 RepID=J0WVX6_AURST|nr:hypothetical protein AURDEDRAFT_171377 [Auricularia subglabra TFB-10046 SS5]